MTATLPLDILNRVERRWSARMKRAGSFPTEADRLKRTGTTLIEGVQPADCSSSGDSPEPMPLPPPLPADHD
jgi:hypothetical protein